jgi:hypothetical protein
LRLRLGFWLNLTLGLRLELLGDRLRSSAGGRNMRRWLRFELLGNGPRNRTGGRRRRGTSRRLLLHNRELGRKRRGLVASLGRSSWDDDSLLRL